MSSCEIPATAHSARVDYEVWGLTGGIGAGKSQAARFFKEAGFPVLDADQVARDLSAPGGLAHAAILKRFGTDERAELRKIIFANPTARKDLEAILHPLIVQESLRQMAKLAARSSANPAHARRPGKPKVIYEAALLVETGRHKQFDGLIVVDAPLAVRKARLVARDRISPELAEQIFAAQTGDAARLAAATVVFTNSGTPEELRAQIQAWIAQLNS